MLEAWKGPTFTLLRVGGKLNPDLIIIITHGLTHHYISQWIPELICTASEKESAYNAKQTLQYEVVIFQIKKSNNLYRPIVFHSLFP